MFQTNKLLVFSVAVGGLFLFVSSSALAQNQPENVAFETVDEVELHGTFYPSNQSTRAPCVLILHDLSGNASGWNEWATLTTQLQRNGFAVLQFDFRGYGKSTAVQPAFWKAPPREAFFQPDAVYGPSSTPQYKRASSQLKPLAYDLGRRQMWRV